MLCQTDVVVDDADVACIVEDQFLVRRSSADTTSDAAALSPAGTARPDVTAPGDVRPATLRVLVAFAVLTLLATNQLLVLAAHTDRYFAWTISARPNSAFLGAAYAAGFVLSVLALRQRRWRDVRVALLTVTVFTLLTLAPTLIHLHKLHLMEGPLSARAAAVFWLAVYLVIPVACFAAVGGQQRQPHTDLAVKRPLPRWLEVLLALQGGTLLVAGSVLVLRGAQAHHFPAGALSFWPWQLTPLTAQVVGAWLVALAVGAGLTIRERDLSRMLVPAATYSAFAAFQLLVLLCYRSQVRPDYPWLWAYAAVLVTMLLTGGYGCRAARR